MIGVDWLRLVGEPLHFIYKPPVPTCFTPLKNSFRASSCSLRQVVCRGGAQWRTGLSVNFFPEGKDVFHDLRGFVRSWRNKKL